MNGPEDILRALLEGGKPQGNLTLLPPVVAQATPDINWRKVTPIFAQLSSPSLIPSATRFVADQKQRQV